MSSSFSAMAVLVLVAVSRCWLHEKNRKTGVS
jgi:hypothetical protein